MRTITTKSSLSANQRWLVMGCHWLKNGTIKNVQALNGEPAPHPRLRVIQKIKFGGENGPRPEVALADFG
jgi:hypothetical protein